VTRQSAWLDIVPLLAAALPARAQQSGDITNLSIEQLANVQITLVSHRPEPLNQAPAAVYDITAEGIRRSGAGNRPEALRLAPNLEANEPSTYAPQYVPRSFVLSLRQSF
jgi:iron complex outermembrane receptor protein